MVKLTGGEKLERALETLANKLSRGYVLRVGFLEGATYPDGTPVAMVAAIQNFGAPARGIPPRPFFTKVLTEKGPRWGEQFGAILRANDWAENTYGDDVEKALKMLGEGIAGQLRQAIVETNAPPLSDITLMLRKMKAEDPDLDVTGATVGEAARRVAAGESTAGVSTKPLVDTGVLLQAVDYEVEVG